MEQSAASINEFLTFRHFALLSDKGRINSQESDRKAEEEYKAFDHTQRKYSDSTVRLENLSAKTKEAE